jgi:hypothetical protein
MKIKYYILSLLVLMSLNSCKKFLTTGPTDYLSPTNYYDTKEQLLFAKAGVYNYLGTSSLWKSSANYLLGFNGDEAYMNRFSLASGPWNYNMPTDEQYTRNYWGELYSAINRANVVLENVDKNPSIPLEFRDQIRGEVLFLRGFFYFMLVQYFGGVPLRIQATASVNGNDLAKASVKEVYDQILTDMTAAEPLVPNITDVVSPGVVSKSAVRGLLARVCLTMGGYPLNDVSKFADAKKWAQKIISNADAPHALNPSFSDIFINYAADLYEKKESIWEVEFWGNNSVGGYTEGTNNGVINGVKCSNALTGACTNYMCITPKYYNIFEPGDARKWWSIGHYTNDNTGPSGSKTLTSVLTTEAEKWLVFPAKWRREYETYLPKAAGVTPQNVPLLRYSDVLLMFAEADNELTSVPSTDAVTYVNKVRLRGWTKGIKAIKIENGGAGYTTPPTVVISNGNGSGASATATISGGVVTGVTLNRDPSGKLFYLTGNYTSAPTITFTGGDGSGATATATVYSSNDSDLSSTITGSKDNFRKMIQDERMRELGMEGLRKADLTRWNIFLPVMQAMGITATQDSPTGVANISAWYSNAKEKNLVWPIPVIEITNNKKAVQNFGW